MRTLLASLSISGTVRGSLGGEIPQSLYPNLLIPGFAKSGMAASRTVRNKGSRLRDGRVLRKDQRHHRLDNPCSEQSILSSLVRALWAQELSGHEVFLSEPLKPVGNAA